MDKIIIRGGNKLKGKIPISGAKNSALTLLPCALLTDEPVTLRNLPRLADIDGFQHLMNQFGISTTIAGSRPEDFGRVMTLEATRITSSVAPYELVRKMRASILVLGPMLARMGEATVSLPGGCAIGNRPIDLHLKALEAFGAEIELASGYVKAIAPNGGLPGGSYSFPVVSVGATENALMAAVLPKAPASAQCRARTRNCRPVQPAGRDGCRDRRDRHLRPDHPRQRPAARRDLPRDERPDRGGQLCLCGRGMTGGEVELVGANEPEMQATVDALREAGVTVEAVKGGLRVAAEGRLKPLTISTAPYPGFATDMQAQFMAMLCLADGASVLTETIFENRYMHVPELNRMGAHIETKGRTAIVHGVAETDRRAGDGH